MTAESVADEQSPRNERPRRRWRIGRLLRRTVRFVVLLALAFFAFLFSLRVMDERFVFYPMPYPESETVPAPQGLPLEDVFFTADDGTRLHGWYVGRDDPTAVILFSHGNAGNVTHRLEAIKRLYREVEASVLVYDYRGYGRSEGRPTEKGVSMDARAARQWLAAREQIDPAEIVLLGRSLGGAVSVDLAAEGGARALVLESTFTSIPDVAAHHYPLLPVRWILKTRFPSMEKIDRYDGPLLASHSKSDTIVPYAQGRQLFEASPSSRKFFYELPAGWDHNDPQPDEYYEVLRRFLRGEEVSAGRGH